MISPRALGRGASPKDKPTAVENSKTEGADLQQYEFGDYETLKWRFTRNNVGMYVIQSLHSGLYMGVTEMSDESGLPIKQYESTFMRQTRWAHGLINTALLPILLVLPSFFPQVLRRSQRIQPVGHWGILKISTIVTFITMLFLYRNYERGV